MRVQIPGNIVNGDAEKNWNRVSPRWQGSQQCGNSGLNGFNTVRSIQVNQPLLHRWTWWNCTDCRITHIYIRLLLISSKSSEENCIIFRIYASPVRVFMDYLNFWIRWASIFWVNRMKNSNLFKLWKIAAPQWTSAASENKIATVIQSHVLSQQTATPRNETRSIIYASTFGTILNDDCHEHWPQNGIAQRTKQYGGYRTCATGRYQMKFQID